MKIFEQFNQKTKCPICNTNKNGKAILIEKLGTQEGFRECIQIHIDCLDLKYAPHYYTNTGGLIYQILGGKEGK